MIAQNAQLPPGDPLRSCGGTSPGAPARAPRRVSALSLTPPIIAPPRGRPAAAELRPLAWNQRRDAMRAWHVNEPGPVLPGTDGGSSDPGRAAGRPLELRQTPAPEPGPGELLLKVLACGVCRTDLHVAEGDLPLH